MLRRLRTLCGTHFRLNPANQAAIVGCLMFPEAVRAAAERRLWALPHGKVLRARLALVRISHFPLREPLSLLPGTVLTALLAPRVAYGRRDALTLLFLPGAFALPG